MTLSEVKLHPKEGKTMIEGYESLELSTQLLINEAIKQGINVEVIDWDDNFIRLKQNGKVEYIKQATRTSCDTYISSLLMENKQVSKLVLKENGIRVPNGVAVKNTEKALKEFARFKDGDIVIKPKSTNFGKGVVILKYPYTESDYENAVTYAFKYDNSVIIEEYIEGKEYRFLVVGDETVAILHRVPANVIGDGVHTIEQLIGIKNQDPLRGKGYVTPLEKIQLGDIEKDFLRIQKLNSQSIPQKDQIIYLRENSNISTGGDSIDFTDDIPQGYKSIAVHAAHAVGAKICGVDMIIKNISEEPSETNYAIIELNFNPALHIHDFPYKGKNRHVEKKILFLLGFDIKE